MRGHKDLVVFKHQIWGPVGFSTVNSGGLGQKVVWGPRIGYFPK